MANVRGHTSAPAVNYHMDTRELEAAMNEVGAFTQAVGGVSWSVSNHVFNTFKYGFLGFVDTAAKVSAGTDPKGQGTLHHVYEPYNAGNPTERLFDLVIPQAVRNARGQMSEIYARVDYKKSTEVEQPFGVLRTGNINARYHKYRSVPFWNKAEILEEGTPVRVSKGNAWVVEEYQRGTYKAGKRKGQPQYRQGLSLITAVQPYKEATKDRPTYHRLLDHFNMYLSGGLADTAVISALERIDSNAIRQTIQMLEQELKKVHAKYKTRSSGTDRSRGLINRGRVFGFSPTSGRGNINKEYIRFLESRIQKLTEGLDNVGG